MRVDCILATHSLIPGELFASIAGSQNEVFWHVFFHGPDAALGREIAARVPRGEFRTDGTNRGLSRSWNEGIRAALARGSDLVLLLNDDLRFQPAGFDAFCAFAQAETRAGTSLAYVWVRGREIGGPYAGTVKNQGFACCAITRTAIETIGYFDENFRPAYWEDIDHRRRATLAGLATSTDRRILVEHDRSRTIRTDPLLRQDAGQFLSDNRAYYARKWGGDHRSETYDRPFDRPQFDLRIRYERRAAPYGTPFDRDG